MNIGLWWGWLPKPVTTRGIILLAVGLCGPGEWRHHDPMLKGGRTSHVAVSDSAQAMLRSLDSFLGSPWVFAKVKHPLQPQNPQSFVNNLTVLPFAKRESREQIGIAFARQQRAEESWSAWIS